MREGFNGVVLVYQRQQVRFVEGIGWPSREWRVEMLANTVRDRTVSKMDRRDRRPRVGDQGRLDLDTPITQDSSDYADTMRTPHARRWLLSHSSGVPNDIQAVRKGSATRGTEMD